MCLMITSLQTSESCGLSKHVCISVKAPGRSNRIIHRENQFHNEFQTPHGGAKYRSVDESQCHQSLHQLHVERGHSRATTTADQLLEKRADMISHHRVKHTDLVVNNKAEVMVRDDPELRFDPDASPGSQRERVSSSMLLNAGLKGSSENRLCAST